jgi:hypothetical protein
LGPGEHIICICSSNKVATSVTSPNITCSHYMGTKDSLLCILQLQVHGYWCHRPQQHLCLSHGTWCHLCFPRGPRESPLHYDTTETMITASKCHQCLTLWSLSHVPLKTYLHCEVMQLSHELVHS